MKLPDDMRRAIEQQIASMENQVGLRFNDTKERPILPGGTLHRVLAAIDHGAAEVSRLQNESAKSERRAITYGDIVAHYTIVMRAAVVDAKMRGPEAGMEWIENTLCGPGHLPDVDAAKAEGGAQRMFEREMAEHEAFRAAHPAPK